MVVYRLGEIKSLLIVATVVLLGGPTPTFANCAVLQTPSQLSVVEITQLCETARALERAVLAKETQTLNRFLSDINPNKQTSMDRETSGFLYDSKWVQSFRDGGRSVYEILAGMKRSELLMGAVSTLESEKGEMQKVVRVFFFDPTRVKLKLPLSRSSRKLWMVEFVTCSFELTKDGWKVYRTFFDDETEGP